MIIVIYHQVHQHIIIVDVMIFIYQVQHIVVQLQMICVIQFQLQHQLKVLNMIQDQHNGLCVACLQKLFHRQLASAFG